MSPSRPGEWCPANVSAVVLGDLRGGDDGKWTDDHREVVASLDCDTWLMTEPPLTAALDGYESSSTTVPMQAGKHWAAVWARRELEPKTPPSLTTAAAQVEGLEVWCSILPWRGAAGRFEGEGLA